MHILVVAAMSAIISGEPDVIIAFSYLTAFAPDFPKGIVVDRNSALDIRKIKARKLLTWLNERGYTDVSVGQLKKQREAFSKVETSLTDSFENSVDENQKNSDNASHQRSKEVENL
jgi:hypothetical protein